MTREGHYSHCSLCRSRAFGAYAGEIERVVIWCRYNDLSAECAEILNSGLVGQMLLYKLLSSLDLPEEVKDRVKKL